MKGKDGHRYKVIKRWQIVRKVRTKRGEADLQEMGYSNWDDWEGILKVYYRPGDRQMVLFVHNNDNNLTESNVDLNGDVQYEDDNFVVNWNNNPPVIKAD